MLAGLTGEERERTQAILTMIDQFAGLADAVAHLRAVQQRPVQADAALRTADLLRTAHTQTPPARPARPARPRHLGHDAQQTAADDFAYDIHAIFTTPQPRSPSDAPPPEQPRFRGPRR